MSEETAKGASEKIFGMVDSMTDIVAANFEKGVWAVGAKLLGRIANGINQYVMALAPLVLSIFSVLIGLVVFVRLAAEDLPFKMVVQLSFPIFLLSAVVFLVEKRVLKLAVSVIGNRPTVAVRPEVLRVGAVLSAAFAIFGGIGQLLSFDFPGVQSMFLFILIGLMLVVLLSNPVLLGVRAEAPKTVAEEIAALIQLPFRAMLAFMPIVVTVLYFYLTKDYASYLFDKDALFQVAFYVPEGTRYALAAAIATPLVMWGVYLLVCLIVDIVVALVSIIMNVARKQESQQTY